MSRSTHPFKVVVFVGLGQMGTALCTHLIRAGLTVVGVDPAESARANARHLGLDVFDSLRHVPRGGDVVVASVGTPDDLWSVIRDYKTMGEERPPVFVNMSTVGPATATHVDDYLKRVCPASQFIESPVTGGVARTARRESAIICGSSDSTSLEALVPLLALMGSRLIRCNSVHTASAAKLVNNIASLNNTLGTIEALAFGQRLGLTIEDMLSILEQGTGASYIANNTLKRVFIDGDTQRGFALELALKDLNLVLSEADSLDLNLPSTKATRARLFESMGPLTSGQPYTVVSRSYGLHSVHKPRQQQTEANLE